MESDQSDVEKLKAVLEIGPLGGGPSVEELREAQEAEFGNLRDYAREHGRFKLDDDGLLRFLSSGKLAVVVPRALVQSVLSYAHGSKLCGHYRYRRTLLRLKGRFWCYDT